MSEKSSDTEHGIREAVYAFNGHRYAPMLLCLCGYATDKYNGTWEDAGIDLDEHLRAGERSS